MGALMSCASTSSEPSAASASEGHSVTCRGLVRSDAQLNVSRYGRVVPRSVRLPPETAVMLAPRRAVSAGGLHSRAKRPSEAQYCRVAATLVHRRPC